MHTHAVHSGLLLRNLRVEIVQENNPVFANEEVSAIIRFRHLGTPKPSTHSQTSQASSNQNNKEPQQVGETTNRNSLALKNNENSGWFGKRLSTQLTNTARSLFFQQFEQNEAEEKRKLNMNESPMSLIVGYVQLSGFFTYDSEVFEQDKIDTFRKKTSVSGKIGGLQGLELSKSQNGTGLNRLITGMGTLFNSPIDELKSESDYHSQKTPQHHHFIPNSNNNNDQSSDNLVPFFSTSQSLLFPSLHLEPGQLHTFYIKCKLPKELPSSYDGNSISINYHIVIGASIGEKFPRPLNVHFPLKVYPYFNENGYQPIANLDQFILLPSDQIFSEGVNSFNHSYGHRRKPSFKTLKTIISDAATIPKNTEKQLKFLEKMREIAATNSSDNEPYENDNSAIHLNVEEFITPKNKDIISNYCEASLSQQVIDKSTTAIIKLNEIRYQKQITKLQTQYQINKNSQLITNLTFSKPFYKIGESVKLSFDFKNASYKTTGVLITVENLELIKESFASDPSHLKKNPVTVIHYKESFLTINLENLAISIPIPLHSTPQFKTNIFEVKWAISLKFIITKDDYLNQVHKDANGELYSAKEHLNGEEFKIRLPIFVLPSDQDFGGLSV